MVFNGVEIVFFDDFASTTVSYLLKKLNDLLRVLVRTQFLLELVQVLVQITCTLLGRVGILFARAYSTPFDSSCTSTCTRYSL